MKVAQQLIITAGRITARGVGSVTKGYCFLVVISGQPK